ncbi:UDP-N-acetylmuramate--L-alanine ligase, partial [Candidatus Parcubacteria bacterium]|nr:UDP-N-acetylmuramate--L-alanine ligase [Candidatus Parcubacteria bacterium]
MSNSKILKFGLNKNNNVQGCDVRFESGMAKFNVFYNKKDLGEFVLKVPGLFNIYNALGAIA